jgi:hypothetical protein
MIENQKKGKPTVAITIFPDTLEKADKIVREKLINGVVNRSALVEYALNEVFKQIFKEGSCEHV